MSEDGTDSASSTTQRSLSIRRQLGVLLAALGLLVVGLVVVTTLQVRSSNAQTEAENRQHLSFQLADSMRKSSNDLTLMVRLYVSTGDPRYRSYYDEILAIRAGTAPRPVDYDSAFWDRVLAEGMGFVEYGPPESLVDQMRDARFTRGEFDALNAALRASNDLAVLELDVMDRVAPRIAEGVDATYFSDVASEYQRLVDADYLAEKGVIMGAIGDFVARVEARTLGALEDARATNRTLTAIQMVILALSVLVGIAAMVRANRVVLRPLGALAGATRRFAAGDYEQRVSVRGVSELEDLEAAFNSMATAVESDVARREHAEREAVKARSAAEEANQAKSTFVAAMSHEIRTPMIGVTGMLEVLAQTPLAPEQQSMVSTTQGSAQVLLQIIGDILDFSKIEAGKLELAPAPFSAGPLVEATGQMFFHTASAKGLWLSSTVDDGVAAAHVGDALRIRQILSNFLSNAIKFTPSGGVTIALRVLAGDDVTQQLEFSVSDTGIGVPPEKQAELFTEFTQADASTAARSGGTGLGLAICRRLARLMGGDVHMESAPGEGTTLYLTVPLPIADPDDVEMGTAGAPGAPALVRRAQPSREVAEQEGSLLLLAEDHPINRRVLVHQLRIIGFQTDTAEDGRRALELFATGRYGLVLTDLNMPIMDGFELTRAIRRNEAEAGLPRTPIVALSANVVEGEAARCIDAGMDDFLGKPAPMAVLADKLRRWMPHVVWADAEPSPPAAPAEPGASASGPGPVIDTSVLNELAGGDNDLAAEILADYLTSSGSDFAALLTGLEEAIADDVHRQAHRIKGASRMVGAREVAPLAEALEEATATGRDVDWPVLRSTAKALEAAIARVAQADNSSLVSP